MKNKQKIRACFNKAAVTYDAAAVLQKKVGSDLLQMLKQYNQDFKSIADVGCGTGYFSNLLADDYPLASLLMIDFAEEMLLKAKNHIENEEKVFLCADFDALPISEKAFDLIFSSLALQWSNNIDITFSELSRALTKRGSLFFATLGPETLRELKECSLQAAENGNSAVNNFYACNEIKDSLERNGFSVKIFENKKEKLFFPSLHQLMRSLKNTGAHYISQNPSGQSLGKAYYKKLEKSYERYKNEHNFLEATYDVIYCAAIKND